MPTKKNSSGTQQEYDAKTGQYGSGKQVGEAQRVFEEAKQLGIEIPKDLDNLDVLKTKIAFARQRLKTLENNERIANEFRKRTPGQLMRTIRSLERRVIEHEEKIKNPYSVWGDAWNKMTPDRKEREIEHWQSEIDAFNVQIKVAKILIGDN